MGRLDDVAVAIICAGKADEIEQIIGDLPIHIQCLIVGAYFQGFVEDKDDLSKICDMFKQLADLIEDDSHDK